MTGEILKKVLDEKRAAKRREEVRAEERKAAALALPDVAEAHREYVYALHESLLGGTADGKRRAKECRAAYLDALAAAGYTEEDFSPRVFCPRCGDSGICNGKLCECVREDFVRELGIACDIDPDGYSLYDFDEKEINGAQALSLKKAYSWMRTYVNSFPDVKYRFVVLSGGTGTGKTMCATAAAREMIKRGHSAVIMSATAFNSLMLKCHTSPYSEREGILADVLGAELLVIDDLGTEPIYNNVTFEYLLVVLSERCRKRLSTIITTNLDTDDFSKRYNERICSRLFDKRMSKVIDFVGDDLRRS